MLCKVHVIDCDIDDDMRVYAKWQHIDDVLHHVMQCLSTNVLLIPAKIKNVDRIMPIATQLCSCS